jgi:hypothetical protein
MHTKKKPKYQLDCGTHNMNRKKIVYIHMYNNVHRHIKMNSTKPVAIEQQYFPVGEQAWCAVTEQQWCGMHVDLFVDKTNEIMFLFDKHAQQSHYTISNWPPSEL